MKCPPLEWKCLLMLTSLKKLCADSLDGLVGPSSGGEADVEVEWQHPVVEELIVRPESLGGPSGKELTELLTHLPRLSSLEIGNCKNITLLAVAVGVDVQQTKSAATLEVEQEDKEEEEEDGLLLFPTHLPDSLRELVIQFCPELVLVDPPSAFLPARGGGGGGGGFQALRSLRELRIWRCPKIFSAKSLFSSPSCCLFPSSLQQLSLHGAIGLGTLEALSNLTSLTLLSLYDCGEDLRCKGLGPLLTAATGGQLRQLIVVGSPRFFAGWDPNPRRVLQDEGGEEQELQQLVSPPSSSNLQELCTDDATGLLTVPICSLLSSSLTHLSSSKLQELWTDDVMGLLVVPTCSFLSSSLTHLTLFGSGREMERFTKEQEDALPLLASLQKLEFMKFNKLQSLPATLHKLTNLKELEVWECPAVRSLPKDGLPKSLQELNVHNCDSEVLNEHCRGLVGTIPRIFLQL